MSCIQQVLEWPLNTQDIYQVIFSMVEAYKTTIRQLWLDFIDAINSIFNSLMWLPANRRYLALLQHWDKQLTIFSCDAILFTIYD